MEDSSYEPDQGWQERGYTYLNSSLQDTVWLKQPAGNLLHTTFGDSHGQKKKKKDILVFNDCEQYEGFNGGTLHSESVFLLAYGVCTFKLFNMIVASCFSQLCFQVRVHGESWIRYLGTKWAVTSWKVIKAANEGQLPLGCEQIILRVPLIQSSDSCTRWIMGLTSNDYKANRILLEMALD